MIHLKEKKSSYMIEWADIVLLYPCLHKKRKKKMYASLATRLLSPIQHTDNQTVRNCILANVILLDSYGRVGAYNQKVGA